MRSLLQQPCDVNNYNPSFKKKTKLRFQWGEMTLPRSREAGLVSQILVLFAGPCDFPRGRKILKTFKYSKNVIFFPKFFFPLARNESENFSAFASRLQ